MELKDLRTALFGFNKNDVCEYISELNYIYEQKEAQKIIPLTKQKIVCPLCIEGKQMDSVEFCNFVAQNTDKGELCFVIGSSFGLDDEVKNLGSKLSFGKITLPHQLMRIVLTEQIYRAGTILNNIEYHK